MTLDTLETNETYHVKQVVDYYDVWGNIKEGFDINNMCTHGAGNWHTTYELTTEKGMLAFLKEIDFANKHTNSRQITLDIQWPHIEVRTSKKHGYKPVCRLEIAE